MVSFSPQTAVCEFVVEQPVKYLLSGEDGNSVRYEGNTFMISSDENPCYRLSLLIKAWFEAPLSERCCGYWFATDIAQSHLGNIIFGDKEAQLGEHDDYYFNQSLHILAHALYKQIKKMKTSGFSKSLFWNTNVVIGGYGATLTIDRFYDQFLEYKMDHHEIYLRKVRDEERVKEIEAIEKEIEQIRNIGRKSSIKTTLYRHPNIQCGISF
tara:strand:+ start:550 stop:1182 length:633 start_codon:yes stop_codon:yes gene_type:complete